MGYFGFPFHVRDFLLASLTGLLTAPRLLWRPSPYSRPCVPYKAASYLVDFLPFAIYPRHISNMIINTMPFGTDFRFKCSDTLAEGRNRITLMYVHGSVPFTLTPLVNNKSPCTHALLFPRIAGDLSTALVTNDSCLTWCNSVHAATSFHSPEDYISSWVLLFVLSSAPMSATQ